LAREFPLNKQKSYQANSVIVRLEHFYELTEDRELSQPVSVNLGDIFSKMGNLTAVEELALGANMKVEELNERLNWTSNVDHKIENCTTKDKFDGSKRTSSANFTFTFNSMQIRTFRLFFV
jgi:hypothetical protein